MTSFVQDPFFWVLVTVVLAAIGGVLRARQTNIGLRRRNANLKNENETLLRQRNELGAAHSGLRNSHASELAEVRKDAEEETKAVLKSAMRTLQGLADEQQLVIEKVQTKYGDDPEMLVDLMSIDHTNSQFGRRAQGIAVLCGGWLGRRETVASVYDVARSAQGRIRQFDRVQIHAQVNFSVVSKVVEPVAVVLAELLANATNYSAPGAPVEINIQAVPKGVCLIVDDAGLGMGQEEKDRASALLSPQSPIHISGLGNPPQFGFAVSGMLAARYGFKVSVDSVSPYGGVRAVILLPDELLTSDAPPAPAVVGYEAQDGVPQISQRRAPAEPPQAQPTPLFSSVPGSEAYPGRGTTAGGLPKRRRQRSVAVVPQPAATAEPPRSQEETASLLGAFQRGTLTGRDTKSTTEGPDHQ
ncbi:ATP-binding protein [Streptomyces uncialis]|uniref:histidine kinase n=1 Tax=Streptomyces uncialis TaxID=1048205 RepID=A0A1Q4V7C0_9ACTN|nr:ATP-binding protein [Streptomyces uncialis]MCX4659608.1 ATP-binding protein [Streptomyces uncialis]OKH93714.1 histidine kinase [Streptomyces uncialis]WST67705.1 ATP-binding protein [Streptomyces uncialis]WTE13667.1 ATP-binding protein [Streptomyces uncialis]